MRINQNVGAQNAYRNLTVTNSAQQKSLEKLTSGYRINRASDDASGLVKSESLRAEIGGTKMALRNAQDGVSFVQTAEGALDEVHSILQRMRDLAVTAANTSNDGTAEQAEFDELKSELAAIGERTTFAGQQVFQDYSTTTYDFQVGAGSAAVNKLSISQDLSLADTDVFGADLSTVDLTDDAVSGANLDTIDAAIDAVSTERSKLGATQNRLESAIRNLNVTAENLSAAESRIRDTDMAEEMVKFTRNQVLSQAGTSMLAQANQVPQTVLQLLR